MLPADVLQVMHTMLVSASDSGVAAALAGDALRLWLG
jgi:hypothetical protein